MCIYVQVACLIMMYAAHGRSLPYKTLDALMLRKNAKIKNTSAYICIEPQKSGDTCRYYAYNIFAIVYIMCSGYINESISM